MCSFRLDAFKLIIEIHFKVPDPANVRPLPVLKQSLDLLKKKWRSEGNYGYICDQFKSMRQDLTVSRLDSPIIRTKN